MPHSSFLKRQTLFLNRLTRQLYQQTRKVHSELNEGKAKKALETSARALLLLDTLVGPPGDNVLQEGKYDLYELCCTLIQEEEDGDQDEKCDRVIMYRLQYPHDIPRMLWGDQAKMKYILRGLIRNALHRTESGVLHISAKCQINELQFIELELAPSSSLITTQSEHQDCNKHFDMETVQSMASVLNCKIRKADDGSFRVRWPLILVDEKSSEREKVGSVG